MTREELYSTIFEAIINFDSRLFHEIVDKIWGQPFDGETERIKPATEESSAVANAGNEADFATKSYSDKIPDASSKGVLELMVERGAKAWKDVPDASAWVEELRGNDAS